MQFPHVDPIPIPAPVWLMKTLSLLTLTLHFFAVNILIGSLVAVIVFSVRGQGKDKGSSGAALVVSRRLPIVMTYVINLGIPPLLFAQVLYGRALYTSTILIAVQWISVVFLVMACYWLLYRISAKAIEGKPVHWYASGALVCAALVGHIYATTMTLMLKPEVWQEMYAKSATGLQRAPHDPTTEPRLLFVLIGGFLIGGFWLTLHSRLNTIEPETAETLKKLGSSFAVIGAVGELGAGIWAYSVHPAGVLAALSTPYYMVSKGIFVVGFALALLVALYQLLQKKTSALLSTIGGLGGFLGLAGAVMIRDGIRGVTLQQKGLDVWNRQEASNWFVIGLFLIVFVLGLVAIGWLLAVMKSARPITEQVNS